jgi:hypothetical protein
MNANGIFTSPPVHISGKQLQVAQAIAKQKQIEQQ